MQPDPVKSDLLVTAHQLRRRECVPGPCILNLDYAAATNKTREFKNRFAPNVGHACEIVIEKIKEIIHLYDDLRN